MNGATENVRPGDSCEVQSRRATRFRLAVALGFVFAASAAPLLAQTEQPETRAAALADARDAKELEPYRPNFLEKLTRYLEERPLFGRDGLYPKLGSLTTGSGFAYGAGYRTREPFRRYGTLDVWTAGSAAKYFAAEARATFPTLAGGRVYAEGYASRRSYPMERFFGIGPGSQRDDETDYLFLNDLVGGRAGVRPFAPLLVGGGLDFNKPYVGAGRNDAVPTISTVFDESSAPGLSRQPDYLRPFAFVEFDNRQPKYAREGGLYRVDFSHYADRDYNAYSFNRVDVNLEQAVSILGERRVLTGRAEVVTTDVSSGQQIPFYLMPTLGGNDSLRGFREYRFRGSHALLLQGEYRFEIWSALDGAFFYDAGKVAERRSDLDFNHLEHDYGFGFRFNTDNAVVMRVDAGFGSRDGKHVYVVFGGRF
jgi:hypothetical protein